MSAQVEIVLIDGGDDIGATTDMPGTTATQPTGPVAPAVSGPRWRGDPGDGGKGKKEPDEVKGPTATESAGSIAAMLGKILGGGQLVDGISQVAKVFSEIRDNVENIVTRTVGPAAVLSPAGQTPTPPQAPTAGPQPDIPSFATPAPTTSPVPLGPGGGPATAPGPAAAPAITGPAAGSANSAASGMSALAKAVGPAGIAVAGLAATVAAGAVVMKGVFNELSNQVKRLENASLEVNVAASMTEVRRELADLRRADSIGPQLARFETLRSKFEDKAYDLWTEVLKGILKIVEVLEPLATAGINGIGVLTAAAGQVNAGIDALLAIWTSDKSDDAAAMASLAAASAKFSAAVKDFIIGTKEEDETNDPFLDGFLSQFAGGAI